MSESENIQDLVRKFGYQIRDVENDGDTFIAVINGGSFKDLRADFTVSGAVCSLAIELGIIELIPDSARAPLLTNLFRLNYNSAFSKIGVFEGKTESGSRYSLIIADTTFFWRDRTKPQFNAIVRDLIEVSHTASQYLAAEKAMVNANPFFEKLSLSNESDLND